VTLIFFYLVAIVLANLSVALFGPKFAVLNCFLFIGLDLTSRDALHDRWHHKNLVLKMAALIAVGSLLSWFLNHNAGQVALASFVAFALSGTSDALSYHVLRDRAKLVKINGSNVVSATIDSIVFVALAFGQPILWDIIVLAIVSKIAGGLFWSFLLIKVFNRADSAAQLARPGA
jgi:uncharacterized PurR-regulated membrane protein YhhQ (DUF165 family)